jgi:hypothetical protein
VPRKGHARFLGEGVRATAPPYPTGSAMALKASILLVLFASAAVATIAQRKNQTVTISDPSPVTLASLLAQADLVAFITIQSGDSEHYNAAIYKAQVTKSYKGAKADQVIYMDLIIVNCLARGHAHSISIKARLALSFQRKRVFLDASSLVASHQFSKCAVEHVLKHSSSDIGAFRENDKADE